MNDDAGIYETNLRLGLAEPLPDYIGIVQEARWWRITPNEYLEMPMEWVTAGRVVRAAENKAQKAARA